MTTNNNFRIFVASGRNKNSQTHNKVFIITRTKCMII